MATSPKQRAVTMKRNGMDDSLVGAILGLEAAEVRSLLYDADPDVELGGGIPELQLSRVVFSDAQIKAMALAEEPVIVPAVEGALIDVLRVQLFSSIAVGYTNIKANSSVIVQYADSGAILLTAENANASSQHVADLFGDGSLPGTMVCLGPSFNWIDLFGGFQQPGVVLPRDDLEGVDLIVRIANLGESFSGGDPDNKLIVQTLFTVVSSD